MKYWNMMLHLESTDQPSIKQTDDNHLRLGPTAGDNIPLFPSVTIFVQTPTQRAWVAAMAAASAAFWARQRDQEERPTSHTALIEKLKAATEPSGDLHADIADAIGWSRGMRREGHLFWHEHPSWAPRYRVLAPKYTSSLDAALGTARNLDEQSAMVCAMADVTMTRVVKADGPTLTTFELCRAALLVRLGGEL